MSSDRMIIVRKIMDIEPGLHTLEEEIRNLAVSRQIKHVGQLWYSRHGDYPGFKSKMAMLVGRDARNPSLRTSTAWNIMYEHLYSVLTKQVRNRRFD